MFGKSKVEPLRSGKHATLLATKAFSREGQGSALHGGVNHSTVDLSPLIKLLSDCDIVGDKLVVDASAIIQRRLACTFRHAAV